MIFDIFTKKESQSLEDILLEKPYIFVRQICNKIIDIKPERVNEILKNVASPANTRGRTEKISIRKLSSEEIELITKQLNRGMAEYGKSISAIKKQDSSIEIVIKADLLFVRDLLLQKPYLFIRSILEQSGLDPNILNTKMKIITSKNNRGLTEKPAMERDFDILIGACLDNVC